MAYLWQLDGDAAAAWNAVPVEAGETLSGAWGSIVWARGPERGCWALVATRAVRLNGAPLSVGLAVLRHRDEILVGGRRLFFTTESLATIAPQPAADRSVICPRCRLEIEAGSPAVRCPGCGVAHHQSDEYPCWTYAERCAMCDQPTALDAGVRWTPEEL